MAGSLASVVVDVGRDADDAVSGGRPTWWAAAASGRHGHVLVSSDLTPLRDAAVLSEASGHRSAVATLGLPRTRGPHPERRGA